MSGDENNNWLNSTPVQGDASSFLSGGSGGGGGSGIDVQPDGLKRYSTQAVGEARNFLTNYAAGVQPLQMQANLIGGSFQEAASFTGRNAEALNATSMLAGDVGIGLSALGIGAMTISINYINGDATSAATLPEVLSAFDTSAGDGLRGQTTTANELPASGDAPAVDLPESQPVDTSKFGDPNDPTRTTTIPLGDNASYTVPGVRDCLDIENATPDSTRYVNDQFRDDLGKEDWTPAPYDPDDYR